MVLKQCHFQVAGKGFEQCTVYNVLLIVLLVLSRILIANFIIFKTIGVCFLNVMHKSFEVAQSCRIAFEQLACTEASGHPASSSGCGPAFMSTTVITVTVTIFVRMTTMIFICVSLIFFLNSWILSI